MILYEMLTGKPAFRRATSAETMTAILNEDPPAVSQLAPSVPPGLQNVVGHDPWRRTLHSDFSMLPIWSSRWKHAVGISSTAAAAIDTGPRLRWKWILATAGVIGLAAVTVAIVVWMAPNPLSGPLDSKQITFSAEPKNGPLAADGSRLYFESRGEPSEMAVSGGIIAPDACARTGNDIAGHLAGFVQSAGVEAGR